MILCNFCQKVATAACEHCSYYYCSTCLKKFHPQVGPLKTHNIIKASSLTPGDVVCTTHADEKYSLFCGHCKILLCLQCVPQHAAHSLLKLDKAFFSCKEHLQLLQTKVDQELTRMSAIKKEAERRVRELKEEGMNVEKHIKREIAFLQATISECEKNLLSSIDEHVHEKCQSLKNASELIPKFERASVKILSDLHNAKEQNGYISLLSRFGQLSSRVEEELKSVENINKPQEVKLTVSCGNFDCSKELQTLINSLEMPNSEGSINKGFKISNIENCTSHSFTQAKQMEIKDTSVHSPTTLLKYSVTKYPDHNVHQTVSLGTSVNDRPSRADLRETESSIIANHDITNCKTIDECDAQLTTVCPQTLERSDVKSNDGKYDQLRPCRTASPLRFMTSEDTVSVVASGIHQRAKEGYYSNFKLTSDNEIEIS